jgi:type II secretory pathway pseudopilin PulG
MPSPKPIVDAGALSHHVACSAGCLLPRQGAAFGIPQQARSASAPITAAFSLIETLATVVILAVLFGLIGTSLVHSQADQGLERVAAQVLLREQRARLQVVRAGGGSVRLLDGWPTPRGHTWSLPRRVDQWHIRWRATDTGRPISSYEVDRDGFSPDLTVEIRRGERVLTRQLSGLSGQVVPAP